MNKLFLEYLETTVLPGLGLTYREYKSSPEQRKYARIHFRQFVKMRNDKGLCYQCNRKRRPNEQRCGVHRNLNKNKCLAWAKKNRRKIRQQYQDRVLAGYCVNSLSHGMATHGILCAKCRTNYKKSKWKSQQK